MLVANLSFYFFWEFSDAISCLDQAVNIFLEIHRLHMAAKYCKVRLLWFLIMVIWIFVRNLFLTLAFDWKCKKFWLPAHFGSQKTQDIGELYEQKESLDQAIVYFERAADLFRTEEATTSANMCNQKVAQISAQLGK